MFTGIMLYFYLPTEIIDENSSQNVQDVDNSTINQEIGE